MRRFQFVLAMKLKQQILQCNNTLNAHFLIFSAVGLCADVYFGLYLLVLKCTPLSNVLVTKPRTSWKVNQVKMVLERHVTDFGETVNRMSECQTLCLTLNEVNKERKKEKEKLASEISSEPNVPSHFLKAQKSIDRC